MSNRRSNKSVTDVLVNFVASLAGSISFVYFHIGFFAVWVLFNALSETPFDPYPFIFLTFIVSLEAIFLSTFVLINQNKDFKRSDKRAELDYAADRQTERDMHEVKKDVQEIKKLLLIKK